MLINLMWFLIGTHFGVFLISLLSINSIEEERKKAYRRGVERGRREADRFNYTWQKKS